MLNRDLIALLQTFDPESTVVVHSEGPIVKNPPRGIYREGQSNPSEGAVLAGFTESELLREHIDATQLTPRLVVIHIVENSLGEPV